MMKAGLVSRTDNSKALDLVCEIYSFLEEKGVEVLLETETALASDMPKDNSYLGEIEADIMITVGGDGTILRTAMQMKNPNIPLLGINMGSRGFLTEVMPDDIKPALTRVLEGDYYVEETMKLSSKCREIEKSFPDSLNEVLISSALPSKALDIRLKVEGNHIMDIQADGLIISTPVGSTAYNLSAGGSILYPDLEAIILTAICPYSYFSSIVIPKESRIEVEMLKAGAEALVIIDGRDYTALKSRASVEIYASEHKTRFIRFRSFYERLERRLIFRSIK